MKDLKFRAWMPTDVDDNDDYCDFVMNYDLAFSKYAPINDLLTSFEHPLMQYTGLKDKNGKEIYEGDIYKSHYKYENKSAKRTDKFRIIGKVIFKAPCFRLEGLGKNIGAIVPLLTDGEIIGNIYENPELLKP